MSNENEVCWGITFSVKLEKVGGPMCVFASKEKAQAFVSIANKMSSMIRGYLEDFGTSDSACKEIILVLTEKEKAVIEKMWGRVNINVLRCISAAHFEVEAIPFVS